MRPLPNQQPYRWAACCFEAIGAWPQEWRCSGCFGTGVASVGPTAQGQLRSTADALIPLVEPNSVLVCPRPAVRPRARMLLWRAGAASAVAGLLAALPGARGGESAGECLDVEEPGFDGGNRQCFGYDPVGMVCGWDGDPKREAYCELAENGLKVTASLATNIHRAGSIL
ncbi:unnamed protein product [Prorocentrum cordatum]|uniref:Uncharacterized protein n=1 Tax=Prorocentrum cordatum TaxID=2364126 RepID=A0ABN9QIS9_9DINO|nr:unnamed protein product [Polarella glacialis]